MTLIVLLTQEKRLVTQNEQMGKRRACGKSQGFVMVTEIRKQITKGKQMMVPLSAHTHTHIPYIILSWQKRFVWVFP